MVSDGGGPGRGRRDEPWVLETPRRGGLLRFGQDLIRAMATWLERLRRAGRRRGRRGVSRREES